MSFSHHTNQFNENELSSNQNNDDLSMHKFDEHFTQQQR